MIVEKLLGGVQGSGEGEPGMRGFRGPSVLSSELGARHTRVVSG